MNGSAVNSLDLQDPERFTPESVGASSPRSVPVPHGLRRHAVYEVGLTSALLFGVVTIVRWIIGPSPISRAIPDIHLQLVLVGAAVGCLITLLILSPLGRASGGHMNPAITLAVWRYKAFPGCGVPYYVVAQLAGSALGPIFGRLVWGSPVARTPVVYAALQPAAGWTFWDLFGVEAATVGLIVVVVGLFLSVPCLARAVPYVVGFLVGAAIAGLGTITGGSANTARQFGPAIVSGRTHLLLPTSLPTSSRP
jgi:glycerol uptake facilitator-like aquaporin